MAAPAWTIAYEGEDFERFLLSLPAYEQAVVVAAVEHVLARYGIDIAPAKAIEGLTYYVL